MKNPLFLSVASGRSLLTVAIAALLFSHSAQAVNTWDGGGANGLWSNNANWDGTAPGVLPTAGNLFFGGTSQLATTNDYFAPGILQSGITFNAGAGAFVLSGNSIGLNGDISSNSAATQTIALDLIVTGGNRNVNSNVAGGNVNISGVVSEDAAGRRFQANGLGTVTLNGTAASTFTGQTSAANNGTLIIDLSNIATHTNLVTPRAGIEQVNLGNGNGAANGTLVIRGATTGTSSQSFGGLLVANGTNAQVVVDANSGAGTTLNLGNTVTRQGGTITFDISSAGASLTGTTLALTASAQTVNQAIQGYALVKDATGTGFAANVGGSLVRYTGATALTAGGTALTTTGANNYSLAAGGTTTTLAGAQTVNSLSISTVGSAGILDLGAGITTVSSRGVLFTGNAAATIQGGQLGALNSEVIVHATGTGGVTIASNISSGTGSLTKSGSDTVTLSGANIYSGQTNVVAGILRAGSTTAFSAASEYNLANSTGVGLELNGFDVTLGAVRGGGTVGGGIALGANTVTLGGKGTAFDYSGTISGTGGVTKVGAGLFQAFGTNTYSGATNINEGTMRARSNAAFGVGSAVTVAATGTLDLWASNVTIGSLSGTGSVINGTGAGTLTTGSNNASSTFSGVISTGGGTSLGVIKIGTGTQTLSGNNTYTGVTTVNAGVLKSGAGSTSAFGVNSRTTIANVAGAILDLSSASASIGSLEGGGTTGGNVSLGGNKLTVGGLNTSTVTYSGAISGAGGSLDKVGTGIQILNGVNTYTGNTTVTAGNLTLGTTGVLNFAIGASGVNNFITGTGAINLNGAFTFDLALASASGTWNIVDVANLNEAYAAGFKVNGFTETAPNSNIWTFNNGAGSTYTFTEATGLLTAIPEPSAILLGGLSVLGLAFRRNRRAAI